MRIYNTHTESTIAISHHCQELCHPCSAGQHVRSYDAQHPHIIELVLQDFTLLCAKGEYAPHTTLDFTQDDEMVKVVFQIDGHRQVHKIGNRSKQIQDAQVYIIKAAAAEGSIVLSTPRQFFFEIHFRIDKIRHLLPHDFFDGHCVQDEHLFDYYYEPTVTLSVTNEQRQWIIDYWQAYADNPTLILDSELIARQLLKSVIVQKQAIGTCELSKSGYKRHADKVLQAKSIIEQNVERPCSLIDLAHQVGTNECTLKKGFKTMTGDTIMSYWTKLRLHKAKDQILDTEESIANIAYGLGYKSPQHFTKAFKKEFGLPPLEYRTNKVE